MAHDPEIIGNDVAIRRDLQVPLMHVRMKEPVAQGVVEKELEHPFAQNAPVMSGRINGGIVAQRNTLDPGHRHHATAREHPLDFRQSKTCIRRCIRREFRGRGAFKAQVKLAQHYAFEMGDHIGGSQTARGW